MMRLLKSLFFWRWSLSLFLLLRGVRLHPAATLGGPLRVFDFNKGIKIGSRTRILGGTSAKISIDSDVWLANDIEIETTSRISIGRGSTFQRRCSINGSVSIGSQCIFAPNVFVSSGTHPFREIPWLPIREQEKEIVRKHGSLLCLDRQIEIQDDCWLGINVVICPGVTVGKGAIVGANSVVVHDVDPYSVVAGSPAKEIGSRIQWCPPKAIHADMEQDFPYVLRGRREYSDVCNAWGFLALNDSPFRCVIGDLEFLEEIELSVYAAKPMTIDVLGKKMEVAPGSDLITVSIKQKIQEGDHFFIDVGVINSKQNALLIKEVRGL